VWTPRLKVNGKAVPTETFPDTPEGEEAAARAYDRCVLMSGWL
jgi:hypothetical protein